MRSVILFVCSIALLSASLLLAGVLKLWYTGASFYDFLGLVSIGLEVCSAVLFLSSIDVRIGE